MGALQSQFGKRIQQLRKAAKLTQDELGKKARMDGKVIGEIERGERNPTLDTIERLVKGLGVEPYEPFLFTFKASPPGRKVDEEMLLNMIQHTDSSIRPFIVDLVQTALGWANRRKR